MLATTTPPMPGAPPPHPPLGGPLLPPGMPRPFVPGVSGMHRPSSSTLLPFPPGAPPMPPGPPPMPSTSTGFMGATPGQLGLHPPGMAQQQPPPPPSRPLFPVEPQQQPQGGAPPPPPPRPAAPPPQHLLEQVHHQGAVPPPPPRPGAPQAGIGPAPKLMVTDEVSMEEQRAQLRKYRYEGDNIEKVQQLQNLDQSIEARLSKFLS
uniref:Uncharacterized protein n=1 Tax=Fibrocapsa japonica TaxID=94617 RepID=A0A7S2V8R8_9STRA|mmetsp:Transcript_9681/g.14875  ORF Transcript_9681/g.14875 Transcript_9681/m.14875 type:complete len:206 (+) Transcript_9681:2-619(+)